jgi:hypothetical protein
VNFLINAHYRHPEYEYIFIQVRENEYITNVPRAAREKLTHFTYTNKMFLGAFAKLRKATFDQIVPCGLTDMTKLRVSFRNAGSAFKMVQYSQQSKVK